MANDIIDPSKIVWDAQTIDPNKVVWDNQPAQTTGNIITGKVPISKYQEGQRNLLGDIVDRPGAAIRSAILNKGNWQQGAINPSSVPTFQDLAMDTYNRKQHPPTNPLQFAGQMIGGVGAGVGGLTLDALTNPANLLMMLAGKAPIPSVLRGGGASNLGELAMQTKPLQALKVVGETPIQDLRLPKVLTSERGGALPIPKIESPNFLRGGLSKEEFVRLNNEYGASNAGLVDKVKRLLEEKRIEADKVYSEAMSKTPKNFGGTIDIRDTVKTMQNVFKGSLGEATRGTQGNRLYQIMNELKAKMPFPKGAGSIPATQTQLVRQLRGENLIDMAGEVRLNVKQFSELRDALNNLYRENPYDRNIAKIMNTLYTDGEKSGLTGLQNARKLQREAFEKEKLFLNRNTGDLKVATEAKLSKIGTDKPLSKQELDHILELQKYIKHPIISDATKINKLNKALDRIKNIKKYGKVVLGTAVAGELGRKAVTGSF